MVVLSWSWQVCSLKFLKCVKLPSARIFTADPTGELTVLLRPASENDACPSPKPTLGDFFPKTTPTVSVPSGLKLGPHCELQVFRLIDASGVHITYRHVQTCGMLSDGCSGLIFLYCSVNTFH